MEISANQLMVSLSYALDLIESDLILNSKNHSRRTAYICGHIGKSLGLSEEDLFDLFVLALLHDNAIGHFRAFEGGTELHTVEVSRFHCIEGEKNINGFPFSKPRASIILYHHEEYDGSGFFGLKGDEIPFFAQILAFANYVDMMWDHKLFYPVINQAILENRQRVNPVLLEAYMEISDNMVFWLDMGDDYINKALNEIMPKRNLATDSAMLETIASIYQRIIDSKSSYTSSHSEGLSIKAGILAQYYNFSPEKTQKIIIAAKLHDIGKLAINPKILDKEGPLSKEEYLKIQSHVYYTRRILEAVNGFEDIADWAANHHEKLNGSGYPYGLKGDALSFESRILGVLDIYQALTEDRPYRTGMSHEKAVKVLKKMADKGELDQTIVADVQQVFAS